jgi:predicted 3-demethylubiquinone-9 3-methyltransferase (glyoxalase superfamily)
VKKPTVKKPKTLALVAGLAALTLALQAAPSKPRPPEKIATLLMFEGQAEEAMNAYVALFEGSKVESLQRYGPGEAGTEGSVMHATFTLAGREFQCIDSNTKQPFTFTPATSITVRCASEEEIERLFAKLSTGGQVFMPLDAYPFAHKFAWVSDAYGVSWQLTLPR